MKQKFKRGDFVRVDNDLGSTMQHFPSGINAIVLSCSGTQYKIIRTDTGDTISWYKEDQLILMQPHSDNVIDIIQAFRIELDKYRDSLKKLVNAQKKFIASKSD